MKIIYFLSGPFLVSRTGDVGWTNKLEKVLKFILIDVLKGVVWLRQ